MTTLTYYVALPFIRADDGAMVPGEAIECPNAETAILQAEFLSQAAGNVGTIAFTNVRPRCVPPGTADIGPNCITGLWLCRHGPARPWPWKAPQSPRGWGRVLSEGTHVDHPTKEQIIHRAYELWEQAGKPEGRDEKFYHQAEQELQNEGKSSPRHVR